MSRLDRHVHSVRNKLAMQRFVYAVAWTTCLFAAACLLAILLSRSFQWTLPKPAWWFWGGAGLAALAAGVVAVLKRPTLAAAAVAIDQKLGLKEKFSTALSIRDTAGDPFAKAAIADAERTAEGVSVQFNRHFPLRFPRAAYGTFACTALALLALCKMPELDLFGRKAAAEQQARQEQAVKQSEQTIRRALAQVEAAPKAVADSEAVKQAKLDLQNMLKAPPKDPSAANRSALKALQDVNDAIKQQIQNTQKFAAAQDNAKFLRQLQPDPSDKGPVADAQRALTQGDYAKTAAELKKAAEAFDKLDKEEQQKALQQMQKMAQQLQQAAQNPQAQQQLQQQLQQMGMNQQQAQQMAQAMQQAAQGNPQAQQQMQQMAQQMMQQMNNGQGPNQQQQQQIQNMLQQMQAQMNNAQAQQQMAQAMQQMAQAMQQMQQQQGQQQAGGQQQNQQMQQAMQQMQQQLDAMEAAAMDAQQLADAAAQMEQAMAEAAGACNGDGEGEGEGKLAGRKDGAGKWREGDPLNRGAGMGGPGIGAGGRAPNEQAPFGMKRETSPTQNQDKGRVLASTFIKDNKPIKGAAQADLKDVANAAQQEAADEVDQERIGRSAQNVVKEYFGSLEKEEPAAPAPQQPK